MNNPSYKDLIREYLKLLEARTSTKRRDEILRKLNSMRRGGTGEIFAIGWQFIVTHAPNKPNLIHKYFSISRSEVKYHDNQPHLKFQTKPVYLDDKEEDLQETVRRSREEYGWYLENIEQLPTVWIPNEGYSITEAPLAKNQMTVRIESEMVDNIVGDIRMNHKELQPFLRDKQFQKGYIQLLTKLVELADKNDTYPDYLGKENFAIHKTPKGYKIAVIDPHVVWVGKQCREDVKRRLDNAIIHFKEILEEIGEHK